MYFIAICDDEKTELEKTAHYLSLWQKSHPDYDFKIECFDNITELLFQVEEKEYTPDLLLMDIYMPGEIGITAAKELRKMGNTSKIVFITNSKEHALDAFSVNASQYLIKPVTEEGLFPVLDRLLEDIEKRQKSYVLFRIDGRSCRIALRDIVCCEAQGKTQRLSFQDNTGGQLHMTMAEIYAILSQYKEFIRVGASYIVNLEHIDSLNSREICLDTGRSIYLPRGAYQPLREQYFKYYCEREEME